MMKRKTIVLCIAMLTLLSVCAVKADPTEPKICPTTAAATLPHEEPAFYSHEMAMLDGCLVMHDGYVRHNQKEWSDFLEASGNGEPCKIVIVQYTGAEGGDTFVKYNLRFDGEEFILEYVQNGSAVTESATQLTYESGVLEDSAEPHDSYEKYLLLDTVLYYDLISEPEYIGVKEIFLHAKEGEPALKEYRDTPELEGILTLLMEAKYVSSPEEYAYGMKLLMTNEEGKDLVIELDLLTGIYRYGQKHYEYGEVGEMLNALGLEAWPEDVLTEFGLN